MNGMRKVFSFLLAVALAAFALSANAAKTITLTDSTVSGQPPFLGVTLTTGTVYVQLNNTGNSNASSLELDWTDTLQFAVSSATINTSKGPVTVTPTVGQTPGGYKGVMFTFTLPQKTSIVIALSVTVNAGTTCGAQQITWQPYAWTGGVGTPSTSFSQPPLGTYKSNLPGAPNCTLSFDKQPADAFIGYSITREPFNSAGLPVTVIATQNGNPVSGVNVTIGATAAPSEPGGCTVSGSATTAAVNGTAQLSISSSTIGTGCALTAAATGFAGATSGSFNVVEFDGTLGCDNTNNYAHPGTGDPLASYDPDTEGPFTGTPGWGLRRGPNTNGDPCTQIPYTFTFDPNNNIAGFVADKLGQHILVEYVLVAKATATVDGWPPFRQSKFAWGPGLNNPPSYPSQYINALACPNDTGIPMPTIPASYGDSLYDQYDAGKTAQMCAAQQGWTPAGAGMVQFWLRVFDSDGWSSP